MGFGMAASATGERLALIVGALLLVATAGRGIAQPTPELPPVAKECGEVGSGETPLPNSAVALQERKKIKILAIGSSGTDVLGSGREGGPPLLEQILERTIRGL